MAGNTPGPGHAVLSSEPAEAVWPSALPGGGEGWSSSCEPTTWCGESSKTRVVGLDLRTSRYFRLNASGAFLWQQVSEAKTREQLVDALIEAYDIARGWPIQPR